MIIVRLECRGDPARAGIDRDLPLEVVIREVCANLAQTSRRHANASRLAPARSNIRLDRISEEPDQPLDQPLADNHLRDDFFLIVDRRRVGVVRVGAGFGRRVYQADFRQVPL